MTTTLFIEHRLEIHNRFGRENGILTFPTSFNNWALIIRQMDKNNGIELLREIHRMPDTSNLGLDSALHYQPSDVWKIAKHFG